MHVGAWTTEHLEIARLRSWRGCSSAGAGVPTCSNLFQAPLHALSLAPAPVCAHVPAFRVLTLSFLVLEVHILHRPPLLLLLLTPFYKRKLERWNT